MESPKKQRLFGDEPEIESALNEAARALLKVVDQMNASRKNLYHVLLAHRAVVAAWNARYEEVDISKGRHNMDELGSDISLRFDPNPDRTVRASTRLSVRMYDTIKDLVFWTAVSAPPMEEFPLEAYRQYLERMTEELPTKLLVNIQMDHPQFLETFERYKDEPKAYKGAMECHLHRILGEMTTIDELKLEFAEEDKVLMHPPFLEVFEEFKQRAKSILAEETPQEDLSKLKQELMEKTGKRLVSMIMWMGAHVKKPHEFKLRLPQQEAFEEFKAARNKALLTQQ